ncbi:MAG: 50S ribosomal protein L14e [Candidatus Aenigmarchaeota archaeon]|nr:50S ribosomal protein L14e [Candidatus Aenigmarchaeota archaeon]
MFETGRICVKTAGREAGKPCVIIKKIDSQFVMVTGPKAATSVRRRKCNTDHLQPLMLKVDIKDDAADDEVLAAFEKEGLYEKLKIEKPSAEKIKAAQEAETAKISRPPEKKEEKKEEKKKKPKPKKEKKEKAMETKAEK